MNFQDGISNSLRFIFRICISSHVQTCKHQPPESGRIEVAPPPNSSLSKVLDMTNYKSGKANPKDSINLRIHQAFGLVYSIKNWFEKWCFHQAFVNSQNRSSARSAAFKAQGNIKTLGLASIQNPRRWNGDERREMRAQGDPDFFNGCLCLRFWDVFMFSSRKCLWRCFWRCFIVQGSVEKSAVTMLGLRSLHRDVCELPGGVCDKYRETEHSAQKSRMYRRLIVMQIFGPTRLPVPPPLPQCSAPEKTQGLWYETPNPPKVSWWKLSGCGSFEALASLRKVDRFRTYKTSFMASHQIHLWNPRARPKIAMFKMNA